MNKLLFVLVLGILIGLGFSRFSAQKTPPTNPSQLDAKDQVEAVSSSQAQIDSAKFKNMQPKTELFKNKNEPLKTEQIQNIDLSDSVVNEMERNLAELVHYVSVDSNSEGWKIHIQPGDRIFMKTGFRDGDILTNESMDSRLKNPETADLAKRFLAVLNRIQK